MGTDADIVIAGGGLNGTALAVALASAGMQVALVEPRATQVRKNAAFDGRSYALSLGSQRLLEALGLWDGVAQHTQPILDIKITDGNVGQPPSPMVLEFDHTEIEEGPMGHMVEDRHLRRALLDAVAASDRITAVTGQTITDHAPTPAGVAVTLSDGQVLNARLLVGCDGKTSATATRAGIKRQGWSYGQTSLVCAIAHERPHGGCAHQYFMPPGPLAILPLKDNRSSIVWTEADDVAQEINARDDAGYLDALRPRFGDFLGEISLAGVRFTYPLALSLAQRFVADRVALVGDAAHAVHPIAGQGLNAGLKDVAALAETLTRARRRGEDLGRADVLARYQQWRRFDTATLALATDTFNKLFSNDNPILRFGRDIGLGLVNNSPLARRSFIREAAGLTGDVPRLNRGLPL
ncbi:MAG: FAD-dependent monooxygenase [Pseudomonadota bacterium]